MKAVIVDDEYYALEGLRMELEEIEGVEIAGMFEDGRKFLDEVERISPDIIFLDIEMPRMNGFELLEHLLEGKNTPNIVFVTAYSHYAVKAFEINAVDYIVKPVTKERLQKTIERIKPTIVQQDKEKIKINCFKHLSIMAGGKEINAGWRTRKAEELIAYLICEKGRFVSKEKIAETLWPGLDGDKSVSNLYLAYYYIKKQENKIGVKIPIESERGKMRIRMEEVACDIVSFENFIAACDDAEEAKRIELMEKAANTYSGVLLEEGYYSWASELQQKYDIAFIELLKELIDYYRKGEDTERLKYYEEKLDIF